MTNRWLTEKTDRRPTGEQHWEYLYANPIASIDFWSCFFEPFPKTKHPKADVLLGHPLVVVVAHTWGTWLIIEWLSQLNNQGWEVRRELHSNITEHLPEELLHKHKSPWKSTFWHDFVFDPDIILPWIRLWRWSFCSWKNISIFVCCRKWCWGCGKIIKNQFLSSWISVFYIWICFFCDDCCSDCDQHCQCQ